MRAATSHEIQAVRPPRPTGVEIAAAILVIGSATDVVISLAGLGASTGEAWSFFALSVGIGIGLALLGVLIRTGRAWLVTVNVVAVAAFLEVSSVTAVGVVAAALDVLVVALLLRHRWWFQWTPPPREGAAAATGPEVGLRGGRA